MFAVTDQASGRVLGACGLDDLDETTRDAGIGYWVTPWGRSRGVARAALLLVTCWAIDAVELDRLYLEIESALARRHAMGSGRQA